MSLTGKVKTWVAGKGFGFIESQDGSADMFVHFRQIQGGRTTLNVGENVTYSLGTNPKTGRPVAENVVGDLTGTPVEDGNGGGSGARGGARRACFGFQKGNCNFGDSCRFSHEGASGSGDSSYGRGSYGGPGGQGMGTNQGGQVFGGGQGSGGYGGGVAQSRFSPYQGQGAPGYGQFVNGGFPQEPRSSQGQSAAGMYGQQGSRGSVPQGAGGYGQQGLGGGRYGEQHGGAGSNPQAAALNYSQHQGSGGFPNQQSVPNDHRFSSQGSLPFGSAQQTGGLVTGYQSQQGGASSYSQQGNVRSNNERRFESQPQASFPTQRGYGGPPQQY